MSRAQPPVVNLNQVVRGTETLSYPPRAVERSDWTELKLPQMPTRYTSVGQIAELPASLQVYVERLDSDGFEVRDAATREIASNPALQADLEAVVFSQIAGKLPPEVSYRLNSALQLLWNNTLEFQQLKELGANRTSKNFEPLFGPMEEILFGIQTGDHERYLAGIQRLERAAALSAAYLDARNGLIEKYHGPEGAIGEKGSIQIVDIATIALDRLLANPSAAEPEMFAEIERLHDLVLERHNLNPQDLHTLDGERLSALLTELHSELGTGLPSTLLKSFVHRMEQNQVLKDELEAELQRAAPGVGSARSPFEIFDASIRRITRILSGPPPGMRAESGRIDDLSLPNKKAPE